MRSCNHALVWKMAGRFRELSGIELIMKTHKSQTNHNILLNLIQQ